MENYARIRYELREEVILSVTIGYEDVDYDIVCSIVVEDLSDLSREPRPALLKENGTEATAREPPSLIFTLSTATVRVCVSRTITVQTAHRQEP
jgi:hypothetical protein